MRVGDAPLRLLRGVEGIDLVELAEAGMCCGFGGTFAVKHPALSSAMLTDKIAHILATEAEVVTAPDSSCLMHIGGGLRRLNAGVRVMPRGRDPRRGGGSMSPSSDGFSRAAAAALADPQLRRNLRAATHTIRRNRAAVVAVSETVDANRSGTTADDRLWSVDRAEQDCPPLVAGRYGTGRAMEAPRHPCRAVALGFATERCAQPLPRSYFSYFVGASARRALLTGL